MKAAVYARPHRGQWSDVARGLEAAGFGVVFQRAEVFTPDQAIRDASLVVCNGLRQSGKLVYDTYKKRGVPVIVSDSGHIRRERGYHRMTLGDHAWLPPLDCPADRLRDLGLNINQGRQAGRYILVAGQQANDSAHNMGRSAQREWLSSLVTELWKITDRELVWRPHPADEWEFSGVDRVHLPSAVPLDESLADAHAVVTYNSTTGLDALIGGVPVWASAPCIYSELAESDLGTIEDAVLPSYEARRDLLARVAYTQWQLLEIQEGAPFRFLWAVAQGKNPFSGGRGWATDDFDALAELVSANVRDRLSKAGLWSQDALREATSDQLLSVRGIGPKTAERLKEAVA